MATLKWPDKDPNDVLDYVIDWTARLDPDTDTIQSSLWIVPDGITKNSDQIMSGSKKTKIWLSGGSVSITYSFVNRVTTVGGRTMDQTVKIKVKEK